MDIQILRLRVISNAAHLLKSRTVEPEKQQLLVNSSETTSFLGNGSETDNRTMSVARQQILNKQKQTAAAMERLDKHVPFGNG
jgi:hypothetical protein